jgi:hypothetical protein
MGSRVRVPPRSPSKHLILQLFFASRSNELRRKTRGGHAGDANPAAGGAAAKGEDLSDRPIPCAHCGKPIPSGTLCATCDTRTHGVEVNTEIGSKVGLRNHGRHAASKSPLARCARAAARLVSWPIALTTGDRTRSRCRRICGPTTFGCRTLSLDLSAMRAASGALSAAP